MIKDLWVTFIERKDFFLDLLKEHVEISLISIIIAILIGGTIGILIAEFKKTAKGTLGIINFLYTIPSISMLGFLIPFSGIGNTTAIIALTIYALLPMVRNTYTGIANVDPAIIEAAKGMGSTRIQILFKIKIPLAMNVIMSGIRSMVTMTIALAGIASFIGAGGLGVAIYRGITTNNSSMTIVGSLMIAILAIVVDLVLGFIEKRLFIRSKKEKKKNYIIFGSIALIILIIFFGEILASIKSSGTIHIATKPMTEEYIMGDMMELLIEQDTDLDVEVTHGVGGGTANIMPAMEKGEFDIYPEYTGTAWNQVLKHTDLYNEDMFKSLKKEYLDKYSMTWLCEYGFKDQYGIGVRKEIADKYNIKTYSDLAKVSNQLVFGAEYDFYGREDGYDAICKEYNMNFKKTMDLDIGLKYQAINQGKIDVMTIFTTDGQLTSSDIVVLKDDKEFFPSYTCYNVIRNEVLEDNPELNDVFDKLTGIITEDDMAKMNYEVEEKGQDPMEVARDYLIEKSLLK